jgi:exopolyphosphatase/guanosine-5'-triphosphate,3'-diphosphate pyrophosphatase
LELLSDVVLGSPAAVTEAWSPQLIGAIDCGSNAIRAGVAEVSSAGVQLLERQRRSVRLGADVFADGVIGEPLARRLIAACQDFAQCFQAYGISGHVAVATSAMRNARNGDEVREAIRRHTGLELRTISGEQEAALVRRAVLSRAQPGQLPDVIADLGGGSLEVQVLDRGRRIAGAVLPVGTVRLGIMGALSPDQITELRQRVLSELETIELPVACTRLTLCGGNAKALAKLYPGMRIGGQRNLDLGVLHGELDTLCARTVPQRMRTYGVKRDRAEVVGTAAVIFDAVGEWLGVQRATVPGVGVLDGIFAAQRALMGT